MNVAYSRSFQKAVSRLSGKMRGAVRAMILEVKAASSISQITDCKKLVGYDRAYRIRVGSYRAFFTIHVEVVGETIVFEYLVPRGEAYSKKMMNNLKERDT